MKRAQKNQGGFTLVEVLIGIIIALIGIVAMFKVQDNWTRQKRSISSGGDAHIAGTISAFQLERDLRNAGMGFSNSAHMGCTVSVVDSGTRNFSFTLAPVLITNGASGAPDSVAILAGNADTPTSVYQVAGSSTTTTDLKDVYAGLPNGELVLVATPGTTPICRLLEVSSQNPNTNGRSIGHTGATYTRTTKPPVNRTDCNGSSPWSCNVRYTAGLPALASPYSAAPPSYGELRSLGDDPRLNVWAVDPARNVLTRTDLIHTATAGDVGDGIVNLQAQYGLDTNNDGVVDSWVDSTASWSQIRMVRFALLVRGENYEKDNVNLDTTVSPAVDRVPAWAGGNFTMTNLDGTADAGAANLGVNNWRNYRYNVFEVMVSLRNMIWTHSS